MAILAFYCGLVLGVVTGITVMALLVMARGREKGQNPEPITGEK